MFYYDKRLQNPRERNLALFMLTQDSPKPYIYRIVVKFKIKISKSDKVAAIHMSTHKKYFQRNPIQYQNNRCQLFHRKTKFETAALGAMLELSRTFSGSIGYAAPEILQNHPYGPRVADVWSIGVILFIKLFAAMPFDDQSLSRIITETI